MKTGDIAIGFKFDNENSAGVAYVREMDDYVGKSGTVVIGSTWPGVFQIHFKSLFGDDLKIWTYPTKEYLAIQREEKLKELGL